MIGLLEIELLNDARHNSQVLERVISRIKRKHLAWQLLDYSIREVY